MKNKILASLLAVCLFAGLAVPAFASATSSVAGDGSKVTKMEFAKDKYELKQDEEKDFKTELSVFESTKKLVIDYQQITWELSGQDTNFTLVGSTVTAVNASGTATLTAKDDQTGKVIAKTTLTAIPNPGRRYAASFKYENQTNLQVPVGPLSDDFTFKVLPITTGNSWTQANIDAVTAQVVSDINATFGFDGSTLTVAAGTDASFKVTVTNSVTSAANTTPKLTIAGVTVTGAVVASAGATDATIAGAFAGKTISLNGVTYIATVSSNEITFTATGANAKIYLVPSVTATTTTSVSGSPALSVPGTAPISNIVTGSYPIAAANNGVVPPAAPNGDNELVFTIPGDALRAYYYAHDTAIEGLVVYDTKTPVVTVATMLDRDNSNGKSVTAKTNVSKVGAKRYETIAMLPNKTIEVGEFFNLKDTVKRGASNANVRGTYSDWAEEYYNDASEANDYAIVNDDGTKVLGVAVGKNKISVTMENGKTAYCTVTVVEKGTKPAADGGNTTVLSAWAPKLGVGETANVVVKATAAVTYTSLDTAVVTVDATGKLTGVKVGTAKVKVQEEGKDAVYLNVTVASATTTPETSKPSDVPQTAVVALAPLF